MIILADNDIIYKLACFDLLGELLVFLDCTPKDVHVLPTFKHQIRKNKKFRGNPIAVARCEAFLLSVSEVPEATIPNLELFFGLDVGEQQLFAVLTEQAATSRLITGDRNALKLVAHRVASNTVLSTMFTGRVECLEGILLGLIEQYGFETINTKISAVESADGVCGMAFGQGRSREHAEAALRSWLNDTRSSASFVNYR